MNIFNVYCFKELSDLSLMSIINELFDIDLATSQNFTTNCPSNSCTMIDEEFT